MAGFSVTFSNVLLTLLYLFPGFLLCKAGKVRPEHMSSVSTILLYICGPCMFLNALTDMDPTPDLTGRMLLFLPVTFLAELLLLLILHALIRKKRKESRWRMLPIASVSGNTVFFGLPIVRALFPDSPEAAAYSCMFTLALNLLGWTVGVYALTGDKKYMSLRSALLNPTAISVAAAFLLYLAGAKGWLPGLIKTGFKTVGAMSTPLCLFILGIRLATMDLKRLFTQPLIWLVSAGKLVAFPLFCYAIGLLLPVDPVFRAAMLILAATPCASILLNLAEMHENGQEMAANCVLLSTLCSIVTLPLFGLLT